MNFLTDNELLEINGGYDIDNNFIYKIVYDFGHDVVYPYIWAPFRNWAGF